MPEKETIRRAKRDKRQGKSASTQAGEFVREEIHHVRGGKHGARSTKQAIAIGLAKARRQGVKLQPPEKGEAPASTRRQAKKDLAAGRHPKKSVSRRRSRAASTALKHEGHAAASPKALSRQARSSAKKRTASERSAAAKKAARTKGPAKRSAAAKKAAKTRARRGH
jgi:hypothetical protein